MEDPLEAQYGKPFKAKVSFLMAEKANEVLLLDHEYTVLRGPEKIGIMVLKERL